MSSPAKSGGGGRPETGSGIQHTTIGICCEPDEQMSEAMRELHRSRAELRLLWPVPAHLSSDFDILICDYQPGLAETLRWSPGDAEAALVLVLPQHDRFDAEDIVALAPNAIVQRPLRPGLMRIAALNAWSQFRYERRLRDRIQRLDENLRAVREVERAKRLLMNEQGLSEEAAYNLMRETAMQRQISVASVAAAMVSAWSPRPDPMSLLAGRLPDPRHKDR